MGTRIAVVIAVVWLVAACDSNKLISTPSSRMKTPFGLTASTALVEHVRLDWSVPSGILPHKLRLERDGVPIAVLDGSVRSYLDTTAAAGTVVLPRPLSLQSGVDRVVLRWSAPAGRAGASHVYTIAGDYGFGVLRRSEPAIGRRGAPSIEGLVLHREGEFLATLPAEARSYEDRDIPAGEVEPAQLELSPTVLSIQLSWQQPAPTPGAPRSYLLSALTELGRIPFAEVAGGSAAPLIQGYRLLRDGEEIAALPATAAAYTDKGAAPGAMGLVTTLRVEKRLDSIELQWEEPPSTPGPVHTYLLETWLVSSPPLQSRSRTARRDAPSVLDYHVMKDGSDFNIVETRSFAYFDGAPGAVQAPMVVATRGSRSDAVALSWATPPSEEGEARPWAVRVHTELGIGQPSSSQTVGRKPPAILRYEVRRGDGPWRSVGLANTYEDRNAPEAPITAVATAGVDDVLGLVELGLEGLPLPFAAPSQTYRVRAVAETDEPGPASAPVEGFRGFGPAPGFSYRWQRSAGDDDSHYTDLPGATGLSSIDAAAPLDAARFYRLHFRRSGVDGYSTAVRAMALGYLDVSAGARHSCGVRSDGSVRCWGSTEDQRSTVPNGIRASQVSAGGRHSCAVLIDGRIRCWGDDSDGQASPPSLDSFSYVSAGDRHSCALTRGGELVCWGSDDDARSSPPPGAWGEQVSAGGSHGCAVDGDRQPVCWGSTSAGQSSIPAGVGAVIDISAGDLHSCAVLQETHGLACWGSDRDGQVEAPAGSFLQVSAGGAHGCAIRTDHTLACWGSDADGRLATPAGRFKIVSAGADHACAVRDDGRIDCWGRGAEGQAPHQP